MLVTVGLDLSLSGLGVCAIPEAWDPARAEDWDRVLLTSFESKPGPVMPARMGALAYLVVEWLDELAGEPPRPDEPPPNELRVCYEGYPMGQGKTLYALDKLCELGGVVKDYAYRKLGLELWSAPQMSARKLVCGRCPPRDRKAAAIAAIRSKAFGRLDDARADECDAVIACNLYRQHLGLSHVWTPEPPKVKRPSKHRSRTQVGDLFGGGA
jgi:hypothetical protein